MKKLLIVFIFCSSVSIHAQEFVDGERLGSIYIGKSTIYDVIGTYGQDYKLKKHSRYSNTLVYEKLGLLFYSCQADPKQEIFTIVMQPPFTVKTQKSITLGKSTFQDLFNKYGRWSEISDHFEYEEIGLYFNYEKESWSDFEEDKSNFAQQKLVDKTFSAIEKNDNRNKMLQENGLLNIDETANSIQQSSNSNQTIISNSNNQFSVDSNSRNNSSNTGANSTKDKSEEELFLENVKKYRKKIVMQIEMIEKGGLRQCDDFESEN
jgi:hypothetical protein